MNTEEKYDLIEKYLDQRMTAEERYEFEQLLENDPVMKMEFELHQQVGDTLKGEKIHQLRDVLKETDNKWGMKDNAQKMKTRTINFRRIITIAATVLLFVMAYQFFFSSGGSISNEQLFADNFQPYQMLLSQRTLSEEEKDVILENAISAYTKGDFQDASKAFQELVQNDPEDISYQFYLAVANLGAENNEVAITTFTEIITAENNPFKEQSQWYLALAYLQNENTENAKKSLKEIQSGQFKYAEAQQILKELE
jgi:tetratricopeptide (TPR) repeat protein